MSQKNNKQLFFRESCFRIAELIFGYPNKAFHIRKLAKETNLSTTAVVNSISELHKFRIVKVNKTDLTTDIRADMESDSYCFYKRVFNLYLLGKYQIISKLKELFRAESIILFGSYAKGEDIEESDVDFLIITKQKLSAGNSVGIFEKQLKRKINLHILPSLEKSSPEFKNAVANGIPLYGYLKVI